MKIVKKKAIATVAALALAGIFGLTQVTSVSADTAAQYDYTKYISTIDANNYRRELKPLKDLLRQKFFIQTNDKDKTLAKIESLESEFITKLGMGKHGIVWQEGYSSSDPNGNFTAGHLEDSFKTETFKTKFNKTEDEAKKLTDFFLQKMVEFYSEKYAN
ncbi:hypothetical protein [Streptococcus halichoeri]|uniref:hypothetical protein n=1 Tax=Streptococcus halichoeri TaxID=254785 RepID=UPI001359F176|nr:hypothetical protein [Streptococcus halichoeri]